MSERDERESKLAALRWVRDMMRARLGTSTTEEEPGLAVAVRMLEQQVARFER